MILYSFENSDIKSNKKFNLSPIFVIFFFFIFNFGSKSTDFQILSIISISSLSVKSNIFSKLTKQLTILKFLVLSFFNFSFFQYFAFPKLSQKYIPFPNHKES